MSITFTSGRKELNVANGNAGVVFNLLGVEPDYCGEVDALDAIVALNRAQPTAHTAEPTDDRAVRIDENGVSEGVRVIYHGRSVEQVARYIEILRDMADDAHRRGVQITWS